MTTGVLQAESNLVRYVSDDVKTAYEALSAKGPVYDLLWRYYEGDQPIRYSTQRLVEIFRDLKARFTENWCSAVIHACTDRLNLTGFTVADDEASTARMAELFDRTELGLESDDVLLALLVCGEAFMIVWPSDGPVVGGQRGIDAYYNDPRLVHVQYDPDRPREVAWAAKWWVSSDERLKMTLYYPDHLEYYGTVQKAENVSGPEAFEMIAPNQRNPYGQVPVFHFKLSRAGSGSGSELRDVLPLQDAVNKLFSDMMVAAEFGAFRQRWVISNADTSRLKNAPNKIWEVPAGDGLGQASQVGEFSQTDLGVYLQAMDRLSSVIAIITRTPKHYLFQQGGDPSGEALMAMEAPLIRKVQRYMERVSSVWKRVVSFMLLIDGKVIDRDSIIPQWDSVESLQPLTEAQVATLKLGVGVSKRQVLHELGYTEDQIEEIEEDRAEEGASFGTELLTAWEQGRGGMGAFSGEPSVSEG